MKRDVDAKSFAELLSQRFTRRAVLETGVALAPLAIAGCGSLPADAPAAGATSPSFTPIVGSNADAIVLPPGYMHDVVLRWGDSLFSDTPDMDTSALASGLLLEAAAGDRQQRQFGTNSDAIHFFALDRDGQRGILCINNEATEDNLMFPGHPGVGGAAVRAAGRAYVQKHPQLIAVAKAAQGVTVVEVVRERGRWRFVKDSRFNRRITAETPIEIGGPARGAALMRTAQDLQGVRVLGTFGNCAGGRTPWGTYLTAEENIQDYFANLAPLAARRDVDPFIVESHRRFRMWQTDSLYNWDAAGDARFDMATTPCEPFRFGWIVEIDPRDPGRAPVKRTALGRFAHEGASTVVARDGRVAAYMGDDDKFEYVYKFVSDGRFDAQNPSANRDLLDRGTLYAARFDASGAGQWLPLVYDSKGPLNEAAGFRSQADVLIKARAAATVLGATPMDRPEDVDVNPTSGRIYIACTRNELRTTAENPITYAGRRVDSGPNAANLRGANRYGHILELREANDDHTARELSWEVFLLAGDPAAGHLITDLAQVRSDSVYFAGYAEARDLSPISSPDNLGFDRSGNLWIVTDGAQPRQANDGCWMCPASGPHRGRLQQFMSGPVGAEVCGLEFTPAGETLFLSIQHPGEGGSVAKPVSHWPDGPGTQPRSSVIAVRRDDGGTVGT